MSSYSAGYLFFLTFFKAKMADFLHVVLLPQAGDLLDWGGSGGQKIDTGGSVSIRRRILPKDFKVNVPQNASSHPCSPQVTLWVTQVAGGILRHIILKVFW